MPETTTRDSGVKHVTLAQALRNDILTGRLAPGCSVESESRLCERFGVSRGPVRQALATLERERLVYRVPGKGSFVSRRRSFDDPPAAVKQVGVVIDTPNSYHGGFCVMEIIQGLNRLAEEKRGDCKLSYEFHRFTSDHDAYALELLDRDGYDGFLLVPITVQGVHFAGALTPRTSPVVTFFRRIESDALSQCYIDHETAAYQATDYLLRYGHRRIALMLVPPAPWDLSSRERLAGYQRAMAEAGVSVDPRWVARTEPAPLEIRRTTLDLLDDAERPTALLIGGGLLSGSALQAIHETGLDIPHDLSVIAFDNVPATENHEPPLTVVHQPLRRAAGLALEKVIAHIEHPNRRPDGLAIKPEIVMRESCSPPG